MKKPAPEAPTPGKISRDLLLEHIEKGSIGDAIKREISEARLKERRALRQALDQATESLRDELPSLDDGIQNAVAALHEAAMALEAAKSDLMIARHARSSAIAERDRLHAIYSEQLIEGASPAIAEFKQWLRDELHKLPKLLTTEPNVEETIFGKRVYHTSNSHKLRERQQGLLAASRDLCERLMLEPDDVVVLAEIERAKAAIPEIEEKVNNDEAR